MSRSLPPFDEIARWPVADAATGAEQMALDETMLRLAESPVLRIYRWARSEVTFGYPQSWEAARTFAGSRPITRRCTGGGFVEHGDDVTIALAVPATNAFSRLAPAETYRRIHAAIQDALREENLRLAGEEDSLGGPACFASPAPADILFEGRKIVGGAQRRSRDGFLYQGSIQGLTVREGFDLALGRALARQVVDWTPPQEWIQLHGELAETRYGAKEWNHRR